MSGDSDIQQMKRQLRVLAILSGARRAGLDRLPAAQLHTIAFFADALAPVWGLNILDGQLLKRRAGPFSPALQSDVDSLVGQGVVIPTRLEHMRDADGAWRLDACYELNDEFASRILEHALTLERQRSQIRFVEEVVLAVSSLPPGAVQAAAATDASYGDVEVALDGLVNIDEGAERPNRSAQVALRFGDLLRQQVTLTPAEMVHLYVRELDKRLKRAA